jgi:hypothetical protein
MQVKSRSFRFIAVRELYGRSQWPRGLRYEIFSLAETGIVGSNPI